MLFPLIAIVAGVLAASTVVIQKLPDATGTIEKIKKYEAFIGAGALVMSLLQVFSVGKMMGSITGMVGIACMVACFILGFVLGFPVIQELIIEEMTEANRNKADEFYHKLTPYKVTAGLTAIGTGIFLLIF